MEEEWDKIDAYQFKERDQEYMKIEQAIEKNLLTLQSVLWGQCDPRVQSKLLAHDDYDEDSISNVFELMDVLKKLCENHGELIFDKQVQTWSAIQQVFGFTQPDKMPLEEYHKEFRMRMKVAKKSGAKLFTMQHLLEAFMMSEYYAGQDGLDKYNLLSDAAKLSIADRAAEQFLAVGTNSTEFLQWTIWRVKKR